MTRLRKPLRQALALALLMIAISLPLNLLVAPLAIRILHGSDEIEVKRQHLAKLTAGIVSPPVFDDLREMESSADRALSGIVGESQAIRFSALQAHINQIATKTNIRILSASMVPQRDVGKLKVLGILIHVQSDIDKVQEFAHTIETSRPYVFIESAHLSALPPGLERAQGGGIEAKLSLLAPVGRVQRR